eukprot:TRINITY_DN29133_c0_g1_i1.p1 TRINITY_DN29133_c0_g1~~TRINITY_DN29133_c0_g1_i1.p1  ORF type:complete len:223 (+),score=40.60 TRINITY_DN29133_c0_g1_i1:38-670(+)
MMPCSFKNPPKAIPSWEQPRSKHVLVLDLDETLIHSCFKYSPSDFTVDMEMDGEEFTAYVRKRPYVEYFLRKCCEMFDVIIWTASTKNYAQPLVAKLLEATGSDTNIPCLYRDDCTEIGGVHIKDLTKLRVPLDKVLIIDNSPAVAFLQPRNHVPISSWFKEVSDRSLLQLLPFLERVQSSESIYDVLTRAQAVRSVPTPSVTSNSLVLG